MTQYQNRVIAFVDLLGFGSLVELSANETELQEEIFEVLLSIQPEKIHENAYGSVNHELVPDEKREAVERMARTFNQAVQQQHPVTITYFSDSLVISADAEDVIASQMILDMVGKLSIRLWDSHQLLVRGGITVGQLLHVENGPLFGPAMNQAYYLESKIAVHPRVLIDDICLAHYRQTDSFRVIESLVKKDDKYSYISLASSLMHTIEDSSLVLAGEPVLAPYRKILAEAPDKVHDIGNTFNDKVREKYVWLEQELRTCG